MLNWLAGWQEINGVCSVHGTRNINEGKEVKYRIKKKIILLGHNTIQPQKKEDTAMMTAAIPS